MDKNDTSKAQGTPGPVNIFEMEVGGACMQADVLSGTLKLLKMDVPWMAIRSQVLRRYNANPENFAFPGPDKDYQEGTVIVDFRQTDRESMDSIFDSLADELGIVTEFATEIDRVSAAVALELWASVFYMDLWQGALRCAGIEGPDALNSLSAILARAFGQSVPCMPLDPEFPSINFESKIFFNTVSLCREFVEHTLGEDSWPQVVNNVVSDMGYKAQGKSRTHNASLLLGLTTLNIR